VINFRYHVVSLTAVFLALAIGLVMGTAALNGPAVTELKNKVNGLSGQNQAYRDQVKQLEADASNQEQFANQIAPTTLRNHLEGRRVLLVTMPDSHTYVDGLVQYLALAAAKVTGQIQINDSFTDPANSEVLLDVARSTAPTAAQAGLPGNSNGAETASYLLADVLTAHPTGGFTTDEIGKVLAAYSSSKSRFIDVTGDIQPADAIVFLAAQPYTDQSAPDRNAAVLTIATQFDQVGPLVVAANGAAGTGNVIAGVRGDPTLSKTISTVDNLATPQGRIGTVLALEEQLVKGRAGHYGGGSGATALVPDPSS
jgi:hypothetical protein